MEDIQPKALYEKLIKTRSDYETRAENLSKITISSLYPADGSTGSTPLTDTYANRYASFAIQNLASQMEITLLPASGSSFRFDPDSDAMEEITQGDANKRAEIATLLSTQTAKVNTEIENQMIRPELRGFLTSMICVSAVVVEKIKNDGIKWHGLRNFGVKLDDKGEPLQIVIREELDKNNLPKGIEPINPDSKEDIEFYTACVLEDDKWTVVQSIGNEIVGKESSFKRDALPYVYLGWTRQKGDTYHRPYVEAHQGTLEDYAAMNKVLVEGSIVASKTILLVNPLGSTRKSDVAGSANGGVIDGREEDIGSMKLDKNYDFQIAENMVSKLEQLIDRIFLSRQGTQRKAERVTAEEVRRDAQELEKNLSGMYSILSKKFNKWLVKQIMKELGIKFDAINVNVITGLDALGRSIEAQKLDGFMNRMVGLQLNGWIKEDELVGRYASYDGIDTINLVKTPDEVAEERQQQAQAQQQQQMMEAGAQSAGQEGGKNLAQQMTGGQK